MLGRETKLGTRLECLAGVSGRPGVSNEVELPRKIAARLSTSCSIRGSSILEGWAIVATGSNDPGHIYRWSFS